MAARSLLRVTVHVAVTSLLWLCLCATAWAQTPTPAALAITKGQEAVALFEKGRYDEALAKFRQADALYHSPVFVLYAGRSLRQQGRRVEALATLRLVAAENVDEDAPPPWKQARAEAKREIAELAAEIPSMTVTVEGATPRTQVTIDAKPAALGEPIELDPGTHRVHAVDGHRADAKEVTLSAGGGRLDVVLTLPPAPAAAAEVRTTMPTTRPLAEPQTKLHVPGLVTAGAGAAAMVAGGVVGVLALNRASSARDTLPSTCEGTLCLDSRKEEIESKLAPARRLGAAADVLLITGGIALAVGAYLMIVHRVAAPPSAARATSIGAPLELRF